MPLLNHPFATATAFCMYDCRLCASTYCETVSPRAITCDIAKGSVWDEFANTITGKHIAIASDDVTPAPNGKVFKKTEESFINFRYS